MTAPDPDIVIYPRRNKNEKEIPEKGILFVNPTEAALGRMAGKGRGTAFSFQLRVVCKRRTRNLAAVLQLVHQWLPLPWKNSLL